MNIPKIITIFFAFIGLITVSSGFHEGVHYYELSKEDVTISEMCIFNIPFNPDSESAAGYIKYRGDGGEPSERLAFITGMLTTFLFGFIMMHFFWKKELNNGRLKK